MEQAHKRHHLRNIQDHQTADCMWQKAWDSPLTARALVAWENGEETAIVDVHVSRTNKRVGVLQLLQLCTTCWQTAAKLNEYRKELRKVIVHPKVGLGRIWIKLELIRVRIHER
jgi:hypothetical protein